MERAPRPDIQSSHGLYGPAAHIDRHFAKLGTIGVQPDGSISRIAYSEAESAAMAYIRAEGEAFGLSGSYDGVGNLILKSPGDFDRRILVGSHLDSVPQGGNFDGSSGIVAALEALRQMLPRGSELKAGVDLVVWRGEEYTFNAVYKGSAAAFGQSEPHILHNLYGNQSLRDAIMQEGFDPAYIDEGRPSFQAEYVDSILAYLELHIEQGAVLEREGKDIGVVTGIAGDRRFLVVVAGRFDHSGATPLGMTYRSDANLAIAHMQTRLDALARERQGQGIGFTQTVGIVNTDPEIDKKYPMVHANSVTKVSGLGYFTLDIMSADDTFMDNHSAEMHRTIWRTAKDFGVEAVIEQTDTAPGVASMDPGLQELIEGSAEKHGFTHMRLASGAGHDAVIVAQAKRSDGSDIPVAMVFVPCKDGVSHSREEFVTAEQVAKGSAVLRDAMAHLARAGVSRGEP